jgi:23S rRNA (guanosine2251-2'-O)-methyltransferase
MRTPQKKYTNLLAGFRALQEAVDAGKEIDKVLIQKGLQGALYHETLKFLKEKNIPWQQVPPEKLNGLTRANHQGVVAFISAVTFQNLEEVVASTFEEGRVPRLLMLDGITDVRNFGAICRTAECHGVDAVIIPEKGAAQVNEDAIKTSAGALFSINLCRVKSLSSCIQFLQTCGIQTVGCTEKTDVVLSQVDFSLPSCIIMGSEDIGISDEILRKADKLSKIPMIGKISSLNVSVAAGIALYEMNRQRHD